MTNHQERIELVAPLSGDFQAVVRLIIGGIAERVDFAFEEIDDLQLAVERLLAEAGTAGTVCLTFEVGEDRIRTRIGPLTDRTLGPGVWRPLVQDEVRALERATVARRPR